LIRRLVPQFGEPRLIVAGFVLVAAGFVALARVAEVPALAGSLILLGLGQGLVSPSVSGLLSRITPESEQGAVFGVLSSAQTLARMVSYSAANLLLGRVATAAPYWAAAGVDLLALAVAGRIAVRLSRHSPSESLSECGSADSGES
jgi:DHA1 family tetracycline resistance protein-like MFS transporter